jgi:hypothetical protein
MIPLTKAEAAVILQSAGAHDVEIVGRGRLMLCFFRYFGKGHVWKLRPDAFVANFTRDVQRELGAFNRMAA